MAGGSAVARRALKRAAALADTLRPPPKGVVVLLYHQVGGGTGLELDLAADVFERQMARVAETGRAASLGAALGFLTDSTSSTTAAAPIVVTFDDGTLDFTDVALPILAKLRVPVTLFASTAFVEEDRPFSYGARPTSWSALADACSTGLVDVGSHTHRHRLLDRCQPEDAIEELDTSIRLIQDRLGRTPHDFAYPKALAPRSDIADLVRARFRSAAVAGTRANRVGRTDVQRLARSPIQRSDGERWFHSKLAGGMRLEDRLRVTANRVRYAGADS